MTLTELLEALDAGERIEGGSPLTAAPVKATDLRAGAAMIIAALQVSGTTEISSIQYIERGYEDIIEKLQAVGADIYAVEEPDEDALPTANIG